VPLDISIINARLSQYWRVSVLELTASTQSDLLELVRTGDAQGGDVVAAEFQSHGRGRLTRSFDAPPHTALLFSFFIQPKRARGDWGWIPLIVGASMAQVLGNLGAHVKWPNDILIGEKKICGIIAEATENGVVIGIGINVGMQIAQIPVPNATSLLIEGAYDRSRNELLTEFLNNFETNFREWDNGSNSINNIYLGMSATIGKKVRIEYPDGRFEIGWATAISVAGELVLDNGTIVQAGDIIHLR